MTETEPPSGQGMVEAPIMRGIKPKLESQVSILPESIVAGEFDLRNRGVLVGSNFASHMRLRVGDRLFLIRRSRLRKCGKTQARKARR